MSRECMRHQKKKSIKKLKRKCWRLKRTYLHEIRNTFFYSVVKLLMHFLNHSTNMSCQATVCWICVTFSTCYLLPFGRCSTFFPGPSCIWLWVSSDRNPSGWGLVSRCLRTPLLPENWEARGRHSIQENIWALPLLSFHWWSTLILALDRGHQMLK